MMKRILTSLIVASALVGTALPVAAGSTSRDAAYFSKLNGKWKGPGEIVAGKYKGTKFVCDLDGTTPKDNLGMTLKGSCRVGVFTQKMEATVKRTSNSYKGQFLDGAIGEGLDVIAGNVTSDSVVLTLKRKQLDGAMLARLHGDNQLNVTVSVKVNNDLVPVIGMKLDRLDPIAVGSVK